MESSNGKYRLYLREAGYLDLTCGETTIWKTNPIKNFNVDFFYFHKDGVHLVLHGKDGKNLFLYGNSKNSTGKGTLTGQVKALVLHDDGNLVLSDACNKIIWETRTSQYFKCSKGLNELVFVRNIVSIIFTIYSKECCNLFMKSDFHSKWLKQMFILKISLGTSFFFILYLEVF